MLPRGFLLLAFFVVLAVVAVGAGAIFLPKAVIEIVPQIAEETHEQTINLSTNITEPDFVRLILPARISEIEVEETDTLQRAGSSKDDFARGTVTLFNNQDSEQSLLPKSHLRHEETGVFVLTDEAVRIPPQGEIKVGVTAKEQGSAGNVPAGKFIVDKLPANLQALVFAESEVALTGGRVTDNPITEQELTAAKEKIRQTAEDNLKTQLAAQAGQLLDEGLINIETLSENITGEVGSRATEIEMQIKLKGRAMIIDRNDILSLTLLQLKQNLGGEEEFLNYAPETFNVKLERADWQRGEARVVAAINTRVAQKTPPQVFDASPLAGRTAEEVREYYKQFPAVQDVEVKFSPIWVSTVPGRTAAVEIKVKQELD